MTFRLFLIAALVATLFYFIFKLARFVRADSGLCPNCDGKGYWYGLREREWCKECDGTGRID